MSRGKTILILGAGSGGLVAANLLRRKLPREHRIVLIDQNPFHELSFNFLWYLVGTRAESKISKSLESLKTKGIDVFEASVERVSPANRSVDTDKGALEYDYLIVSLGAQLAPEAIDGFSEGAYNLYDLKGIMSLKDRIKDFTAGDVRILISSMPFKCPAAPYEASLLLDYFFRKNGVRDKINISVSTPEPQPMPTAGPVMGEALKGILKERGIGFFPNRPINRIDNPAHELVFEHGGKDKYDLLIGVPAHKGPEILKNSGLTNESGWITVDPESLKTSYDNVFAIGDVTSISLPGRYKEDKPLLLPKAGVFAHYEADVVAHNIAAEIQGRSDRNTFDGRGFCFLELGYGKAAFAGGNFYTEPHPTLNLKNPNRRWHLGKVLFEKWWLWRWF